MVLFATSVLAHSFVFLAVSLSLLKLFMLIFKIRMTGVASLLMRMLLFRQLMTGISPMIIPISQRTSAFNMKGSSVFKVIGAMLMAVVSIAEHPSQPRIIISMPTKTYLFLEHGNQLIFNAGTVLITDTFQSSLAHKSLGHIKIFSILLRLCLMTLWLLMFMQKLIVDW